MWWWDGRGVFRVVFGSVMGNARLHVDVAGEFELGSREELGLDVTLTSVWCAGYVVNGMYTSLTTTGTPACELHTVVLSVAVLCLLWLKACPTNRVIHAYKLLTARFQCAGTASSRAVLCIIW